MANRSPRQVRFLSATIKNTAPDKCVVKVEVRAPNQTCSGTAEGGSDEAGQLHSAALATSEALAALGHKVELDDVAALSILGDWCVAVRVIADHEGERRKLMGFCVAGTDVLKATVLALLNATNRFLEIG